MTTASMLANPRVADDSPAAAAREAIAGWLLDGPAQVRQGPHAGAVAGSVDAEDHPIYAYPEITGYYLQWLAWRAACRGAERGRERPEHARRAEAAQQWLARWIAGTGERAGRIETRVDLVGDAGDDWRNSALFCFDLAMVLRGVATAARERLIAPDPQLVAGLCAALERLIGSDGAFDACVAQEPGALPPQRWSTQRGGFLAKAAAGILSAAPLPGITHAVLAAAAQTLRDSLRRAAESPHDDVHALLYTFEGVFNLPSAQAVPMLPVVTTQFDGLLDDVRGEGRVPESRRERASRSRPERLDVLAQTLRIGDLLRARRGHPPPDRMALARLRQALVAHVEPAGTIPFAVAARPVSHNVWAAMFAEQALGFAVHADDASGAVDLGRLLV